MQLMNLTLYDVNVGRNRLRELFAAVPGLRGSLLAKSAKRFEESFHVMMQRRVGSSSVCSSNPSLSASVADDLPNAHYNLDMVIDSLSNSNLEDNGSCIDGDTELRDEDDDEVERTLHAADGRLLAAASAGSPPINGHRSPNGARLRPALTILFNRRRSSSSPPHLERQISSTSSNGEGRHNNDSGAASSIGGGGGPAEQPETIVTGGLCSGHFQERVINVSNAPPVQLKRRRDSGQWEIGQGSGGLVSCCDPVMGKDTENVWLACFGPDVPFPGSRSDVNSPMPTLTNSLGLPIIRPTVTEVKMSMLQEQEEGDEVIEEVRDQMSLLGVLRNYNKDNYKLNPVIVSENDYHTYYGGISNGLLWPALHTLTEYIVKDYDDPDVLRDHWNAYVRVNYQFALNAVRKSRPQDFLWIHDYHLILTGMIIQSLDANIEIGFFLHIPFQPPPEFFTKFQIVAEAVVRGLMRFTKALMLIFKLLSYGATFEALINLIFPS
uniref:Trehalose-6-phosphate synthase n=1 Tax=Romanomermis culicivorax TaxID=13658 RepID=A0A915L7D6_ROMCU